MSGVPAALQELKDARFLERLWARDPSLWKDGKAVKNSLGWLSLPNAMAAGLGTIRSLASEIRREGFETAVVLGTSEVSLACAIFKGRRLGIEVLDGANPADILSLQARLDWRRTLFIAASKSGSNLETNSLLSHFHGRLLKEGLSPERQFIAITDPGTSLEKKARRLGFRKVFVNPPDVGGPCTALSYFGLVPAALAGMDVEGMLVQARRLAEDLEPALELGALLGAHARAGRDTLTLILPPGFEALGLWIEQLAAGILPIVDGSQEAPEPAFKIDFKEESGLGRQFLLWETAVAAAGFLLKVNPFAPPDAPGAPDRAGELLAGLVKGKLASEEPSLRAGGLAAFCDEELSRELGARPGIDLPLSDAVSAHLNRLKAGDFCAVLAFVPNQEPNASLLLQLRDRLRKAARVPVTMRSAGRLHNGGKPRGLYIMLVAQDAQDLPIPGEAFTFGTLQKAQARSEHQALVAAGRRILRLDLGPAGANSLQALLNSIGEKPTCPK